MMTEAPPLAAMTVIREYSWLLVAANEGRLPALKRPGLAARMLASARRKAWDPDPEPPKPFGLDFSHRGVLCCDPTMGVVEAFARLDFVRSLEQMGKGEQGRESLNLAAKDLAVIAAWAIESGVEIRHGDL